MITLSSDFRSPYPAAMKGVILGQTDARLVDVTHDLPRQDVRASAFWLTQVLPYFPPAVHCAVVDPGVGTDRDAIAVRAGDHVLVGPDNGVLLPPARALSADVEVFVVDHDDPESATFHGRDVFAPTAARVHDAGVHSLADLDGIRETDDFVDLTFPEPTVAEAYASGVVLAVDGFGNAITNLPGDLLAQHVGESIKANGVWASVRRTYAEVDEDHRVVTVGSHGNVELAVNQGRGDDAFGVEAGQRVKLAW
ncbi:S-adenosyl-l-methionine hydroxide adenosyltransferase family protein [Halobacteriales archaeon Cl-PHB]